ncbi:type II toxin-antitoxin system HicB family antitoxin [Allomesorhizobium alhagi]|uniref:HicB family protein n=1 Tax=Mesorhizobium alhagi CCNWXJ12-2 TaxID=1107882 RepID=H0HM85_9HYPH|nr:type II toxin-antitoxin system HicB family antitoxin [Mesorhizobium alhagi]EHK58170.1 hypothetical protein MAXJ12_06243 [Mesorhizobium alhagi CCNWXJ12-2]
MSTVKYKGYQASVEYEDGTLFIKVLHVDDLLIAQCESAADVDKAFAELIEGYLADCAELGKSPTKPFKGSFNVRMTPELHKRSAMAAADAGLTLNSWIVAAATDKLECGHLTQRVDNVLRTQREEIDPLRRQREEIDLMQRVARPKLSKVRVSAEHRVLEFERILSIRTGIVTSYTRKPTARWGN